ncbi:BtrH N-terminal domain-containing protein [Tenacibaculum larymnensis]|uniref:BtrH N-terminal domain-containing protein n=1 Tax=Tenacibaculum larymnensis TaxID=2878201 RepID=A0A9X4IN54_9FLAO|nr:BtrH N-terminal domain-containing protein [Tenacibaculum larymnensis]MDE1208358.1 BtrH N-terminal domain-containing protein [Tenacibaculum larymnensis]
MIIKDFKPFNGQHCETTTTGSLLYQLDINLSEPMLFGLGEGLGYIFWNMKIMDFPFIGGRVKPDVLTENICRNLNLDLEVKETSSIKKAWKNVQQYIAQGKAVGLKLDCYHLDYFTTKIHFAGHYASIYGYDDQLAYLNDTNQQGRDAKTTLKNLELARNEKGPMSSRNLSYIILKKGEIPDLKNVIKPAIYNNATDFLNPPIKNIGYKGILKTSTEIKKWFESSKDIKRDFQTSASLMENGGTGGSLFRKMYSNFLKESGELLNSKILIKSSEEYSTIAKLWTNVADLFNEIGETKDIKYINYASEILIELSEREKIVMEQLKETCSTLKN